MFLDDPLEDRRVALPVPGTLGIDDGDRPAFADAQAVRLRAKHAALLRQAECLQARLQIVPRREAAILVAAFRLRLIAAEKDVPPGGGNADAVRNRPLRIEHQQPLALRPSPKLQTPPHST